MVKKGKSHVPETKAVLAGAVAAVHDDQGQAAGQLLTGGKSGQEAQAPADGGEDRAAQGGGNLDWQIDPGAIWNIDRGMPDDQAASSAVAGDAGTAATAGKDDTGDSAGLPSAGGGLGGEGDDDDDDGPTMTLAESRVYAAYQACRLAYDGHSVGVSSLLGGHFARPVMTEAAAFLRQWPDAPADAVVIHLRRKGFRGVPDPGPRELAAWKLLAFTLACLDEVDRQEAEAKAAEEAKAAADVPSAGLPLDQALIPQAGPFDASSGFSPRR